MSDATRDAVLERLRARLETEPGFVGHDLARWSAATDQPQPLGDLAADTRGRLTLCRSPRRTEAFAADIRAIADHTGVDASRLARFYRLLDAMQALRGVEPVASDRALLAAARDVADGEQTYVETPSTSAAVAGGALPGWLTTVVDRFWADSTDPVYPRDLELHVLLHLPIAVIEVAGLTVATVRAHLGEAAATCLAGVPDRRVYACLIAFAGVGIVFVDADDNAEDRRVNIAHETAHFLLDYLVLRERLAAHDPALLDVMDGLREPTPDEELGALLAEVPLGVQTHVLERNASGGHVTHASAAIEDRAELVAWELLAPRAEVLAATNAHDADTLTSTLRQRFGLPNGVATAYGAFLSRLAASRGDSWFNLDD